ncbi:MAG: hypothetical protein NT015_19170 [Alphaproteobacteria bacterium]|nr:hypothetical protein [Alphaproteobacteria bacterium]
MKKLVKSVAAVSAALIATTQQASAEVTLWVLGAARHGDPHRAPHRDGFGFNHGRGHGGHGGHGRGGGFGHHGDAGGGSSGGGVPSAPEIDVSQAAAAIIIVLVAFLLIREIYLRQRPQLV